MIAILVLGTAIATCVHGFALALRGQARARSHVEAVQLADERLRALALLPPDSLLRYREVRQGRFAPPFERFRWSALVRTDSLAPELIEAAVRVDWTGGSYDLETALYVPEARPIQ